MISHFSDLAFFGCELSKHYVLLYDWKEHFTYSMSDTEDGFMYLDLKSKQQLKTLLNVWRITSYSQ